MSAGLRRAFAAGCATALTALVAAAGAGPAPAAPAQPGSDAWQSTHVVQRTITNADGSVTKYPEYKVTVKVDRTRNLRGRQRVLVSWSGAQPSGGRAANPYGENGLQQEYPVVILQCRGVDDG